MHSILFTVRSYVKKMAWEVLTWTPRAENNTSGAWALSPLVITLLSSRAPSGSGVQATGLPVPQGCVCVWLLVVSDSCNRIDCSTRLLCPWDPPGKNTGVGCHFLLQGIFPTQESNPGLLHCGQILYQLSYEGALPQSVVTSVKRITMCRHCAKSFTHFTPLIFLGQIN